VTAARALRHRGQPVDHALHRLRGALSGGGGVLGGFDLVLARVAGGVLGLPLGGRVVLGSLARALG